MRDFNITGLCVPRMHYMVDISAKVDEIAAMVDKGLYFTINRARQFGKTTTFFMLGERLNKKYLAVRISFEGVDDGSFTTNKSFCDMFAKVFARALKITEVSHEALSSWQKDVPADMFELDQLIASFCVKTSKPVVLMIDEVDKTSNNQVFLNFLGMLRDKYLRRSAGEDSTFQSVILAGVYDVKNLKRKITGEEILSASGERIYNSPWNIAADFKVKMSFAPNEIATMLTEYENDWHTGMNINEISGALYRRTNGYPFLVSKLCKMIAEDMDKDWTIDGVERAVKAILQDENTLFDDMFKNIENNKKFYDLIYDIMVQGREIPFSSKNPTIELGAMFGIIMNKDGKAAVSNEIFELVISEYLVSKMATDISVTSKVFKEDVVKDGKFNMALCLEKFAGHYYEIYSETDEKFLEKHGRILFITYLRPLINGQGFYHMETETRNTLRMDLVVDYGSQQFVVEMKLWHGDKRHEDAYEQLWKYLDAKDKGEGYLLTFDFRKDGKKKKGEWVEYKGKRIFDVVV
ncbi:MAG: AAA-like domain-containing protein [Clostridiales bacterium]|jgi:hypothetical protein|nr:AAA-like domain-containing protein [Clostridiales bacterium]